MTPRSHRRKCLMRGAMLLEAVIALLVFSIGITGALLLLANSVQANSATQYRAQAALLIDAAIAGIWTGDRNPAEIGRRYAPNADEYLAWRARVESTLPGAAARPPLIQVGAGNTIAVVVNWREPGADDFHQLVSVTRVAE